MSQISSNNLILQKISSKFGKTSERSKEAVLNIAISLTAKGISILSNLLIVPLTIHYVNPTRYGIWLTLSSVISWIAFFDLGLGNGFRNKFAEARAKGDNLLARKYLSTTYFVLSGVVTLLYIALLLINHFIDWPSVLHVDKVYFFELREVFAIIGCFFCLNMVFNIFSTMLTADQKIGFSSLIVGLGQLFSLAAIFILTRMSEGSLINLATYYAGVPCLVMLIASIIGFTSTRYREMMPSLRLVDLSLVKNILNIGIQFFVIYICLLLIFQVMNIVISRELGPEAVTQYNVAFKYFNLLHMVMMIIISPFWSAFTDAYTKNDYTWMKSIIRKLEQCWLVCVGIGLLMLLCSPVFYRIWIGDEVKVGFTLSFCVLIYILSQVIGAIYMQMINGIGTVRIQMITYILFALFSLPLMMYSCRLLGIVGIVIMPSIVYLGQAIIGKIQLHKLMTHTASGIWNK
jgi:O-antigen/teichoic acid export membrane protein